MDSKIEPQQGLYPNEVVEGGEENRQGKTSMLNKVKAKARKIRDTIKMKTGRDHKDLDNNQNDQGHEEEEDGDEDDKMVEDSEAHDAVPVYESPAGQRSDDKLGKPATAAEDQSHPKHTDPRTWGFPQGPDENTGNHGVDAARSTGTGLTTDVQVPENRDGSLSSSGNFGTPDTESAGNFVHGEGGNMGHPKISTETPTPMEEDPHALKDQPEVPNYQSEAADPTGAGGEEAGITQILHPFNKMNVHGESESKSEGAPELYSGSHDQFSPEPIQPAPRIESEGAPELYSGSHDQFSPEPIQPASTNRDGSLSSSGNFGAPGSESAGNFVHGEGGNMGHPEISTETPTSMEEDPHAAKDLPKVPNYQSEVADPTGASGEEAGITQILHPFNKMNAHGESESKSEGAPELYSGSHDQFCDQFSPEPIQPAPRIESEGAPEVYSGSHDEFSPEPIQPASSNRDGSLSSSGNFGAPGSESAGNFVHWEGGNMGHSKISTETPTSMEEDPHVPKDQPEVPNYQSKAADPTGAGGEEAGITQILHPFNKMNVHGEPESKSEGAPELYSGSHDQFSPEPIQPAPKIESEVAPELYSGSHDQFSPEPIQPASSNRDGLLSSSGNFGVLGSESAGNFVHGEGGNMGHPKMSTETTTSMEEDPHAPKDQPEVPNYESKVADPTGAGGEEAGITQILHPFNKMNVHGEPESKSEGAPELDSGSHDQFSPEPIQPASSNPRDTPLEDPIAGSKAIQGGEYGSNEDPIAGSKAIQGGEEIGKIGKTEYGLKIGNESNATQGGEEIGNTGTTAEYGQKTVPTVTEKLAPVYEKVSSVGKDEDEDKALSDVKEVGNQGPAAGIVTESEEVKERLGTDEDNREMTENEPKVAANVSPTGKGMVESVKEWWFSKGGDQKQHSEASPGTGSGTIPEEDRLSSSTGEEAVGHGQNGVGERRVQESG